MIEGPERLDLAAPADRAMAASLAPVAQRHILDLHVCLRCGETAPGPLRVAIWEEEEKGRLGARPTSLCAPCHDAFFAGAISRVEIARWYHEARGTRPHGWIGRIDRDALLDVTCLECGVLLPLGSALESDAAEMPASGTKIECRSCRSVNRLRMRGGRRTTAELVR